jgi:hypothetical protein
MVAASRTEIGLLTCELNAKMAVLVLRSPAVLALGMVKRALNWGRSYWQGRVSPAFAVVIVLIGGRLAVRWLYAQLPPDLSRWIVAGIALVDAAFLVWQITGALRATRRELEGQSGTIGVWGCHGAVLGAFGVAIYGLADLAAARPVAPNMHAVAPPVLPREGGTALLLGEIGYDAMNALDATLAGAAPPKILRIESNGGLVHAARAIALRVEQQQLATEVTGDCFSACTLIFMAGSERTLGPNGRLGFHGYAFQGVNITKDTSGEQARDEVFFARRGLSDDFVARIFDTPHDQIWMPSRAELVAAGVIAP